MKSTGGDGPVDDDEWRYAIGEQYGSQQAMVETTLWQSAENLAAHDAHQKEPHELVGDLNAAFNAEAKTEPRDAAKTQPGDAAKRARTK